MGEGKCFNRERRSPPRGPGGEGSHSSKRGEHRRVLSVLKDQ